MKSFKMYVSLVAVMMHSVSYTYFDKLDQTVAEYNNQVVKAGYSLGSSGNSAILLQFQEKPICFYAPSSYQESLDENVKSFILPRTIWLDRNIVHFMEELELILKPLHIQFECQQLLGKNFGLKITFHADSSESEIKKIIYSDKKVVCFEIKLKK